MHLDVLSREQVVERRKPLRFGAMGEEAQLRVAMLGIGDMDERTLRAMFVVAEPRIRLQIRIVDPAEAQLVISSRAALRDGRVNGVLSGRAVIVVRQDADPVARADDVVITSPMRLMPVLDAIEGWVTRLGLRPSVPVPVVPHDQVPGHTGTLAHALLRIFAQEVAHDAHVRAIGFGELSVLTHRGRYRSDITAARLREAMRSRRFVITGNCDEARRLPDTALRPLRELRWVAALEGADPAHAQLPAIFRMTRWPDFGSLPHDVEHLKLSALLSGRDFSLDQACAVSAMTPEQVVPFLMACRDGGYLVAGRSLATQAAVAAPEPARTGLFDRLRRRFGF